MFWKREPQPVIYEVRLEVDVEVIHEFDEWLAHHASEMLEYDGFRQATAWKSAELTSTLRAVRIVAYEVESRRKLDRYLRSFAANMRADGLERFPGRFSTSRRIVPLAEYTPPEAPLLFDAEALRNAPLHCDNCYATITGEFCANCGQPARNYLTSLFAIIGDFIDDTFNYDSRFFRTLRPLLLKPGFLTNEFVRSRRQHYLPPVRMYIFVSLLFFFAATLLTDLSIIDKDADSNPPPVASAEELQGRRRLAYEEELEELNRRFGIGVDASAAEAKEEQGQGFTWSGFEERLESSAREIEKYPGAFMQRVMQHIPTMMFVFLPLVALVLKLAYIGSRRYYVEHLVFTLHYHSAVFLIFLLWLLWAELVERVEQLQVLAGWVSAAVWIYITYYLYRSMRRVYGQGRVLTLFKFSLLFFAYFILLAVTFGLTIVYTMFTET